MKSPVQSRSSHTSWWKMHEGGHPVITWCYKYSRRLRLCFCASHFHSLNIPWVLGAVYMISHFFNFKFHFILLYNTVLVLPYIDMNPPQVYMSFQTCTPSHLPPHIISLDHPHAPAPSILYPVSNIDWQFVSYLIVYIFQCHSPKTSHPLPLPQSPKVCSTHLCPFCCLAYRVIITIFLNSIYMC